MNDTRLRRGHTVLYFFLWLTFIVYGSLVPFALRESSLEKAVETFLAIRYLNLGVVSRADWVANILLYMPLAFFGCVWIAGAARTTLGRAFAVAVVSMLCFTVAVVVEFAQIFFAPRTVSLNDLLAETLGTLGGITIWIVWRQRLRELSQAFTYGGRESMLAAIILYLLVYVVLSLFPFDFLISADEIVDRLSSNNLGWFIAGDCRGWVRCVAPRLAEALAIAPVGMLAVLVARGKLSLVRLFLAGTLLGLVLELLQILVASGISQGVSVLLRGAGLVAGALLGQGLRLLGPHAIARVVWRTTLFAAVPYLVAVAALNGWFLQPWIATELALERLADTRLMPFYYHYFTTETVAMVSLLAQAAMYAPIGLVVWARAAAARSAAPRNWLTAALIAPAIALPIEFGKLWGPRGVHPDFTNLLIAATSAAFTCALGHWLESILSERQPRDDAPAESRPQPASTPAWALPSSLVILMVAATAVAVFAGVMDYPAGTPVLVLSLLVYGVLLYQRPTLWLLVIPALLPVLDLSPITGRLLLDEFDLLVLVTLTVGYWRVCALPKRSYSSRLFPVALSLLWATWLLAMTRGLWPALSASGEWWSASSHAALEPWQVGKGFLWALLLVPLLRRVPRSQLAEAQPLVLHGLVAGLLIVTVVVAWERHVFVGIADFDNVFRVTGSFANMRTGGAYIEAFIAFAFPVLCVWVVTQPTWGRRLIGIAVAPAVSYAMLVTFSRVGYVALLVGMVVVIFGVAQQRLHLTRRGLVALAGMILAAALVAVPVLSGGFAQQRLTQAAHDFSVRMAHWKRALDLMEDGLIASLAGMGFGRYPTLYLYAADVHGRPGTYSIQREADNSYLRLGSGEPVYLEQLVNIEPGAIYTLSASIRKRAGNAVLSVPICEKALLYSFECHRLELRSAATGDAWSQTSVEFAAGNLGSRDLWPHRPTKLSLHNASGDVIDVDNVSLKSSNGRELVANGDFESAAKRWLLVSDKDLAWHIHQQAVETYFAQGLAGMIALLVLLLAAGRSVWPELKKGSAYAIAMTGAVASFLTVGLLGSVVDTARSSMLLYLGLLAGGLLVPLHRGTSRASSGAAGNGGDQRITKASPTARSTSRGKRN